MHSHGSERICGKRNPLLLAQVLEHTVGNFNTEYWALEAKQVEGARNEQSLL